MHNITLAWLLQHCPPLEKLLAKLFRYVFRTLLFSLVTVLTKRLFFLLRRSGFRSSLSFGFLFGKHSWWGEHFVKVILILLLIFMINRTGLVLALDFLFFLMFELEDFITFRAIIFSNIAWISKGHTITFLTVWIGKFPPQVKFFVHSLNDLHLVFIQRALRKNFKSQQNYNWLDMIDWL